MSFPFGLHSISFNSCIVTGFPSQPYLLPFILFHNSLLISNSLLTVRRLIRRCILSQTTPHLRNITLSCLSSLSPSPYTFLSLSMLQIKSEAFSRSIFDLEPFYMAPKTYSGSFTMPPPWLTRGRILSLNSSACLPFASNTSLESSVLYTTSLMAILYCPRGKTIRQKSALLLQKLPL